LHSTIHKNNVGETAMEEFTNQLYLFKEIFEKKIIAAFDAGQVSSDGGLLLVREMESCLGLISKIAGVIRDSRHSSYIEHSMENLLCSIFCNALGRQDSCLFCKGYQFQNH
jgi:hypothetical protein